MRDVRQAPNIPRPDFLKMNLLRQFAIGLSQPAVAAFLQQQHKAGATAHQK